MRVAAGPRPLPREVGPRARPTPPVDIRHRVKLELVVGTKREEISQALANVMLLDGGAQHDDRARDEITRDESGREQRPRDRCGDRQRLRRARSIGRKRPLRSPGGQRGIRFTRFWFGTGCCLWSGFRAGAAGGAPHSALDRPLHDRSSKRARASGVPHEWDPSKIQVRRAQSARVRTLAQPASGARDVPAHGYGTRLISHARGVRGPDLEVRPRSRGTRVKRPR
jgi:hypothetical protein